MPARSTSAPTDKRTAKEIQADLIAKIDFVREYKALGANLVSDEPRANGAISCYSLFRKDDTSPSAYINTITGKYGDSGAKGKQINIWQVAFELERFASWELAREDYANRYGETFITGKEGKKIRKRLAGKEGIDSSAKPATDVARKSPAPRKLENWLVSVQPVRDTQASRTFICQFMLSKGGFDHNAFTAGGGFYSTFPHNRTKADGSEMDAFQHIVGLPIYGPAILSPDVTALGDSHAVGAVIWNKTAEPFRIKVEGKEEPDEIKMRTVASADGLIGREALQAIIDDRRRVAAGEPSQISRIWKVEGPTCKLALFTKMPEATRRREPIISCAGGSTSVNYWMAELVRGYDVVVCHDNDEAGQEGVLKTCEVWGPATRSIMPIRLPGDILPKHGPDVRDFLNGTGDYESDGPKTFEDFDSLTLFAEPFAVTDAHRAAAEKWRSDHAEWLAGRDVATAVDALSSPSTAPTSPQAVDSTTSEKTFGNVKFFSDDDDSDESSPATMLEIIRDLQSRTDNWPRAVGGCLFVPGEERNVHWISSTSSLFGWIQGKIGSIQWRRGSNYVTKEEFFSQLSRTAMQYDAVEQLVHVPEMPRHFYTWTPKAGDGSTLRGLLDRFCPSSDVDYDLILSLFASIIWGGNGGTRPIYIITSTAGRGSGKTTLAEMVGEVAGGFMSFGQSEELKDINARLLSDEGLKSRVCFIDNIKSNKFSSSEIEALVTASRISGRRLFKGEGSRPNTLVWIFTFNGVSLSRDLAQRSIIIKLGKPPRSATWEEDTRRYVREKRDAIIGDLVAFYSRERTPIENPSRWASWESAVLSRLAEPSEAQVVVSERQLAADVEVDENDSLEDFFAEKLQDLHYDPDNERIHIPSNIAARWYSEAMNQQRSPTTVTRIVNQMNQENTLKRIRVNGCHTHGRGLLWWGKDADPSSYVLYSLEQRIEELKVDRARKFRRDY